MVRRALILEPSAAIAASVRKPLEEAGYSVTVLRGKVMVADGKFHGDLKDGRYLKRKIAPQILERNA